jgi:hypothetical protein
MWQAETRAPTHYGRGLDNSMRAKCCLHSMEFLAVLRNSSNEPNKVNTKKCHVLKVYYTKIKQKKNRMLL